MRHLRSRLHRKHFDDGGEQARVAISRTRPSLADQRTLGFRHLACCGVCERQELGRQQRELQADDAVVELAQTDATLRAGAHRFARRNRSGGSHPAEGHHFVTCGVGDERHQPMIAGGQSWNAKVAAAKLQPTWLPRSKE